MIDYLKQDHVLALDGDTETAWIRLAPASGHFGSQISWDGLTGTYDGVLEVLFTNGNDIVTVYKTIPVDSESNVSDAVLEWTPAFATHVKYRLTVNGITGGNSFLIQIYQP